MLNVIDISSFQGGIDIAGTNADGVIIKTTQGAYYESPYWREQLASTQAAGRLFGFYHFVDTASGAELEARTFVNSIKDYIGQGILVLDWEGNPDTATDTSNVQYAKAWLDSVYQKTGVRPIIYMSKSVAQQNDWSSVSKDYGLWFAQYADNTPQGWQTDPWTDGNGIGSWENAVMFQYENLGRIAGWNGDLDLDLFYGDKLTWQAYAAKEGTVMKNIDGEHVWVKGGAWFSDKDFKTRANGIIGHMGKYYAFNNGNLIKSRFVSQYHLVYWATADGTIATGKGDYAGMMFDFGDDGTYFIKNIKIIDADKAAKALNSIAF